MVFGCAFAFVGFDAMAASRMAESAGSSPKPPEAGAPSARLEAADPASQALSGSCRRMMGIRADRPSKLDGRDAAQLLDEDGIPLIHTIGHADGPGPANSWVARYIWTRFFWRGLTATMFSPILKGLGLWGETGWLDC